MKYSIVLSMLFLVGCATTHPTTEMDRELALKLADKTPIIVTTPAPVINVNNYNGQAPSSERDELLTRARALQDRLLAAEPPSEPVTNEHQENCVYSPRYDANGNFLSTVRRCFGSQ